MTWVLLAFVVLTPARNKSLHAQQRGTRVRVLTGTALRTTPGGPVLGTLSRTLDADVELDQGASVRVRIAGFVRLADVDVEPSGARATVSPSAGGTFRTGAADGEPVLAELRHGTVLFPTAKVAGFLSAARSVWIDKTRLTKPGAATSQLEVAPRSAPAASPSVGKAISAGAAAMSATGGTPVQTNAPFSVFGAPAGNLLGEIKAGTSITELATENGWTRVRLEGWVRTKELSSSPVQYSSELTAADLRSASDGLRGRIVHWNVEALSYQLADGLRRELEGAPYILALGPGKERSVLYLAVPDSLVPAARGLSPMSLIAVTARVRTARSQPGGIPILDILELFRR